MIKEKKDIFWNNLITVVFLGSVFFTSEKFNSTQNSIKYYYTALSTIVGVIFFILKKPKFNTILYNNYLTVQKGLFSVGLLQAFYGILQFFGACSSNHHLFKVTGSFENPAGFASVISLLYPIGLYWCLKLKGLERCIFLGSSIIILISVILSGSRTGMLAVLTSTITLLLLETNVKSKLIKSKYLMLIAISLFSVLFLLYKWKSDSVGGRILIWRVSTEMIKNKPLFGFGINGFQSNYMDYQARYFKQKESSKYEYLADNVTNPFNEFVRITVNFGFIGLLIFLIFLCFIFFRLLKFKRAQRSVLLCIYVSLLIFSCFSYPFHYAHVWFLMGYFTLILLADKLPVREIPLIVRVLIICLCFMNFFIITFKMCNDLQWKDISQKSLHGRTKEMLPKFAELYPKMKRNELFLYNYGAELNYAGYYRESTEIMNECCKKINDYDLQMILADNYYHLKYTLKALETYKNAADMIPCRFLPLYCQFEIYKESGDVNNAIRMAQIIVSKRVKVKSIAVNWIIEAAKEYLKEINQQHDK